MKKPREIRIFIDKHEGARTHETTLASRDGDTALHLTAFNEDEETAAVLVKANVNLVAANKQGKLAQDLVKLPRFVKWLEHLKNVQRRQGREMLGRRNGKESQINQ